MEERDRIRLKNLAALLDSPVEGERVNALSAINRLLDRHALKWRDINSDLVSQPSSRERRHEPPPRRNDPPPRSDDRDGIGKPAADALMSWLASLVTREDRKITAWEADFCNDIYERLEENRGRTRISERQWEVINRIKKKNGDA